MRGVVTNEVPLFLNVNFIVNLDLLIVFHNFPLVLHYLLLHTTYDAVFYISTSVLVLFNDRAVLESKFDIFLI